MRVVELIRKQRDGVALSETELRFLVQGFANGSIPDYQASAWLMAAWIRGMSQDETFALTRSIKDSGSTMNWRALAPGLSQARFADKHSTGGVGDKVSLLLAPLAACLGVRVPMMSGRSLGHTGGTLDKLESIPGFQIFPEESTLIRGLESFGVAMMGQSELLCPADRKLYSLRDVTGTVESIPLITASIVSKKWAEGVDAIVYDVKCGEAAFMPSLDKARELAQSLVHHSKRAGLAASALITEMEEPLGSCVGNALEVQEILWILSDVYPNERLRKKSQKLISLTHEFCVEMSLLSGVHKERDFALKESRKYLSTGQAKVVFEKMCQNQGSEAFVAGKAELPRAPKQHLFRATQDSYVRQIHARKLGDLGLELGIGRKQLDSRIHPGNGFVCLAESGDLVKPGDVLLELHYEKESELRLVQEAWPEIFEFSTADSVRKRESLILERIS